MSRCSKTTTARPGSGKLSRAKHVVRQRLQPTLSPHLSSLWDCDSSLLAAPKSAIPRSASRAHLVGLHLPSGPGLAGCSGRHTHLHPEQRLEVPWAEDCRQGRPHCASCFLGTESSLPDGPMDFRRDFLFTSFGLINYTKCIKLYAGGYTFTYVYTCVATTQKIPKFPAPQDALLHPASQLSSLPQGQPLFCFLSRD